MTTTKTNSAKTTEVDRRVQLGDLEKASNQGHRDWIAARDAAFNYRHTSTFQTLESRKSFDPGSYTEVEAEAERLDGRTAELWDAYQQAAKAAHELRRELVDAGRDGRTARAIGSLHARTVRILRPLTLGGVQRQPGDIVDAEQLVREHGVKPSRLRFLDQLGWLIGLHDGDEER